MDAPNPEKSTVPRDAFAALNKVSEARAAELYAKVQDIVLVPFNLELLQAHAYQELAALENDSLRKLRLMLRAQLAFEELSEKLEALSKATHAAAEHLACKLMPDVMDANEMEYFGLTGGRKVVLDEKIHATLKKEDREKGCAELEKRGYGSLVKRTITVPFNTKQGKLADKVVKAIERAIGPAMEVEVSDERNIHHSTLAKWVRDSLERGDNLSTEDMKLFGIHRQRRIAITEPKE